MQKRFKVSAVSLAVAALIQPLGALGGIPAAHVYHNHMPNFWPFYAVDVGAKYNGTAVGQPIRYTYDAQVINLKKSPPAGYNYYLPASAGGTIMPHDDLATYYAPDAKTGAYQYWPMQVANEVKNATGNKGQVHVTMSGAVVNNVQDLNTLQNVPGYSNPNWGASWKTNFDALNTVNGFKGLDTIHFTGHHSMGPLVGADYFLKDLIFQNVTLAQPYFLGSSFKSSKGFFPTELGFSERLIPTLAKLGVQWSVIGNNHFSRTLKDYPYDTYYPTKDTIVSPPNRADLRNTSTVGSWVANGMAHEQQVIVNKFPFASTPHNVRWVDAATGAVTQLAGIPVDQNGSWLEGWEGSTTVDDYVPYASLEPRQFFVVAHDGDNSGGRAGALSTWQSGYSVTCTGNGYCLGIDEYLKAMPIPASDVQHVQDGSWVDTRDSSSDPQWHHWKLPFSIWKGQFAVFNSTNGTNLAPKKNLDGVEEGMTVSYEYGFHYLERNFALLQAAMNYAKTAEQIWLDGHPNHWSPTTALDNQITYPGNQLNPWMMSFPVKGDAANNYAGGANPAELAWYFLLPAMDSGFGYYDENKDDHVKGTLAFNNSLYFSKPYVTTNLSQDKTGPSVFWPQRWPYNPGSVNGDKSEGWTVHHFSNTFSIYTYAYDVSGLSNVVVKIRPHTNKTINNSDDTYKVYDPAAMVGKPGLSITPANVGAWKTYSMNKRDLKPVINGVAWNKVNMDTMAVLPAQEIGDLYYSYISDYRDQLVDYYVEATDAKGNVTKSEIQQVYVGTGRYNKVSNGYKEDINGTIEGTYPFLVVDSVAPGLPGVPSATAKSDKTISLSWTAATDNIAVTGYEIYRNGTKVGTSATNSFVDTGLTASTAYSYTVLAYDAAQNKSSQSASASITTNAPDTTAPTAPGTPAPSAVTASAATLTWTAATDNYGVDHYDVYRGATKVGTTTAAVLTFTDSALSPSTTYSYTVVAVDAAGNVSAASAATPVTTAAGNVATVYYYRTDWTAVNIHHNGAGTWTVAPGVAMTQACTGYWKTTSAINLGAATSFMVDFNNGSTWDNNGGGNYTLGTGTTLVKGGVITANAANPCGAVDSVAPTAPTALTAGTATLSSVAFSWTASTDNVGVTAYDVYRNGTKVGSVTGTSYTDTGLAANTSYSYTVIARDAAANSSVASAALSAKTLADTAAPTVPASVAGSAITSSGFTVAWAAATDNVAVTAYDVQVGATVTRVTGLSTAITGLTANTAYAVSVRAVDAAGNASAYSTPVTVTTAPVVTGVVVNFKITATTTVGQNLYVVGDRTELSSWNSAAGVPCSVFNSQGVNTYPVWNCQAVTLPASTAVAYKYIKRNGTAVTWLSGANNTLTTPASGTVNISDTWR